MRTGLMMDREELRRHIDAAEPGSGPAAQRLVSLLIGACWPGGPDDRSESMAIESLRGWHPDAGAAALPRCSCSTGHCVLCN
jgi:hypothetical protein